MTKKKRNIVEWAMHYRQIVIMVACCLVAFGVYGLADMNKNEFPDFTVRQGVVVAVYPGVSAQDVEEQLTKPLENYIFSYKEVKKEKTKSYSRNGMAIIQIELNDDVSGTDKDNFWSKFKHGINTFKAQLPSGVLALMVQDDFGDTSALLITMESKDKTYRELNDYMDDLKDRLRRIESIGRMNVLGMQKEQISIYLDSDKMSHYGIGTNTIAASLFAKGFVTTAGTQKGNGYDSPIQVERSLNVVGDVEQLVVYSDPSGNVVRLKDVARVRREYPQPSSYVTNNGQKCLVLSVEMKKGRSITAMGADIEKVMDEFKSTLPSDVTIFTITDQTKVVNDSVVNFLRELLIAIAAVVIVIMLFLPMRVALVAASTIPISIFISLGLFYAFGIELNTVTLAALIVTLGMIVDNSIVIIDSYMEMLAEGKSRWTASISSATHFFKSIFSATLAISITFFPFLLTTKGMYHDFLLYFPWSITIVLLISLLVAELIVPFLQFYFIRKPVGTGGKKKFSFLDLVQRYYDWLIGRCFAHPYITVSVGVASIVIGSVMVSQLPQKMMPTAERNQFAVEIYLPDGTSLKRTAAVADELIPVSGGLSVVPLRQIADVKPVWADGQIAHRNGLRTITVMADVVNDKNVMELTTELQKSFDASRLPSGVTAEWGGEYAESQESLPQILSALAVAVVIIFFILVWHFHRINTAVLLLVSLAMTIFGTSLGVVISGVTFSLTCFLGIISLMGILVRNAIIMYDYAEELREKEKLTAHEAIFLSAKRRMRPIFLTSAAASMGVIPMILGGSGLWMPMGSVICYGTLVTMLLILTVLPVAYWLMMSGSTKRREAGLKLENE